MNCLNYEHVEMKSVTALAQSLHSITLLWLLIRDVHMIIEGQGLKVRKEQYVCAHIFF